MKTFSILAVVLVLAGAVAPLLGQSDRAFRLIGIPCKDAGYGNFTSRVIDSQKQFDAFVEQVEGQKNWTDRACFLKMLRAAKVDFTKESLVLVRRTEPAGPVRVSFAIYGLGEDHLACGIHRDAPATGSADVAHYCFAVAVEQARVKLVHVWVGKDPATRFRDVLAINPRKTD